jgi:hypothetical protein
MGNSVVIIASHRGELKLGLVSRVRILPAAISGLLEAAAAAIGCLMTNPIGGLAAAIAVMLTTAATLSSQAAVVLSIFQSSTRIKASFKTKIIYLNVSCSVTREKGLYLLSVRYLFGDILIF